jgi:hypothetical protein
MHCPVCRAVDVIEINHVLPDATEVTFFSCHGCEERWWDEAGRNLPLEEVLRRARAR